MKKTSAIFIIGFVVIITLPIFFITIPLLIVLYNKVVKKKNKVEFSYSGIDVMLKKRMDLIPNMVSSVQKIMTHEKTLLENITRLREQLTTGDPDPKTRLPLENEMSQLLGTFSLTMENYPDLKSNDNMLHLQRTLNETEEQIGASRRAYNAAVVTFNDAIMTIPTNVIAGLLSYQLKTYFEAPNAAKENPNVGKLFG